jgi:isoleucyl-tRNA synthetase
LTVIEKYGADIVRWWVVSQNFMEDTRCGENLLAQVAEMYRRIRNTFRFLLNNLYDFDPATDAIQDAELVELDRWALAQLDRVVQTSVAAYDRYEFHRVYQSVLNFCGVELSAFYLDVLKDRLYASAARSPERRSAQTAMHRIAETLARLLAPVLVHTTDEVWGYLKLPNKPESVHLADLPTATEPDTALIARWEPVLLARDAVKKALEEARQAQVIGNPLESRVELLVDAETYAALTPFVDQLPALFLVSQAVLSAGTEPGLTVRVSTAEGVKCPRCWLIKTDVGSDPAHPDLCARCADAIG